MDVMNNKSRYKLNEPQLIQNVMDNLGCEDYTDFESDDFTKDLILKEIKYMLFATQFSRREIHSAFCRAVVWWHSHGYNDREIADSVNKYMENPISVSAIQRVRLRSIEKLEAKFGKTVGIITVIYEAFKKRK